MPDYNSLPPPMVDYPLPSTVGVPNDGRTLTVINGNYTTTSNGQDLYNLDIRGDLNIIHNNVRVRYCKIAGEVDTNSTTGTQLWFCTVAATQSAIRGQCVGPGNYIARRCDVSGSGDGFRIKDNVEIRDCYVHDLLTYMDNYYVPPEQSHCDGVKCDGGSNNVVIHNRFDCWPILEGMSPGDTWGDTLLGAGFEEQYQNAGIMVAAKTAPMSNWVIEDNLFQGPAFKYVNFGFSNSVYAFTSIAIVNNRYHDLLRDNFTNGTGKPGITVSGTVEIPEIIQRSALPEVAEAAAALVTSLNNTAVTETDAPPEYMVEGVMPVDVTLAASMSVVGGTSIALAVEVGTIAAAKVSPLGDTTSTYTSTYTSAYTGVGGASQPARLAIVVHGTASARIAGESALLQVSLYPDRPTAQLIVTNVGGSEPREATVARSSSVAGQQHVRYLYKVVVPAGVSVAAIDDEAPLGTDFVYTLFMDGERIAESATIRHDGPWFVDDAPTWAWLRHLSKPSLSVPCLVSSMPSISREARYGQALPLGAGLPVVTYQPRGGRSGDLELTTKTNATGEALAALLDDGSPVQLAVDPQWHVFGGGLYMAVLDVDEDRPQDDGLDPFRIWTLDYTEVNAPPAAGSQSGIVTFQNLYNAYATFQSLLNAANAGGWTYADLLTDVTP